MAFSAREDSPLHKIPSRKFLVLHGLYIGNGICVSLVSQHAAVIGLCDIFRGNGMIEAIDDADGLGAFVGDDLCSAEEDVGHGIAAGVLLGASDEEEDDAAGFSLGKIALSCLGLLAWWWTGSASGRGGGRWSSLRRGWYRRILSAIY